MAYVPNSAIVQFFTGALSTSAPSLGNADKIAIDTYSGHLSGATDLGMALDLIDVLAAAGQSAYLGFSTDGMTWHDTQQTGDMYIRFAMGLTRPVDTDASWSVGVDFVGPQGIQGAYNVREYINATSTPPALADDGSFDVATRTLTPSADYTADVTAPGAGENTYFRQWLFDPAVHTGTVIPSWSAPIELGGTGPAGAPGVTLGELFLALVSGAGISFDDTTPGQRTINVDATIARLDSPVFTGDPTLPTAPLGDDDLSAVNSAWVQREITGLVDTVAVAAATLTVTDRDGTARSYTLPGSSGLAGGTGDLQIEELLNRQTSLNLPAGHVWVGTTLTPTATVEILLVDASDATDDYEVIDWDGVKVLGAGISGQVSAPNTYHTFQAHIQDITYEIRIGHTATNEILLAANQNAALGLPELRIDRMLAPIEALTGTVHGNIEDWAVRDSGVQQTDPTAWSITTGQGLTVLGHGDRFFFRAPADNAGAISLTIDLVSAIAVMKLGTGAASLPLDAGDIEANRPVEVAYDAENGILFLTGGQLGTAAYRSFGTLQGDVPLLGNNGLLDIARIPTGVTQGQIPLLGLNGVLDAERLAVAGTDLQLLGRTATGTAWVDRSPDTNEYVDTALLSLNGSNQLVLTLERTGSLVDVVSNPLALPEFGLTSVATDTAFGGDGSTGDPLTLDIVGADFPVIPIVKGGTGAIDAVAARLALGLGTVAVLTTGIAAGQVPVLGPGGVWDSALLAPDGTLNQVLTRTANGQIWADVTQMGVDTNDYVDTAVLSLNASNELLLTLGRTGTLADVVSVALTLPASGLTAVATNTAFGGDGSTGDPLTLDVAGVDFPVIPLLKGGTGAANAVDARTMLGLGSAAVLNAGTAAGELVALNADGVWDAALLAPDGTPTQVLTRTVNGQEWAAVSAMGVDTNNYVDTAALSLNGSNELILTLGRTGSLADIISSPLAIPAGATDGTVSGLTATLPNNILTLEITSTVGGPFTATVDFGSLLTLPAGAITSGTFNSVRLAGSPDAGEFLSSDGSDNVWAFIRPNDIHGGAAGQFVRSNGTIGAWAGVIPADLASNPVDGQLLQVVSGALGWVSAAGLVVVDSIIEGIGIVVDMPTGNVTLSLEEQFQGRTLGTVNDPQFVLSIGTYTIRLEIAGIPTAVADYGVGDTFTFHVPDPITNVGNDNTPLALLPGTSGGFVDIVSPLDGSVLTRSDLVPGSLHTVRLNHARNWALVEPEVSIVRSLIPGAGIDVTGAAGALTIGVQSQYLNRQLADGFPGFSLSLAQYVVDLDILGAPGTGYGVGDTLTFVVPDPITNLGTATTPLSVRVNTGGEIYFVVSAADRTRLTRSDLVPGGLHTVRFNQANEFSLVEPSTIGGDTGGGISQSLSGTVNP